MSPRNTYTNLPPQLEGYVTRKFLERGEHLRVIEQFAQFDPQPPNQTKTRKWRRYESLPDAVAPLAEGVSPTGSQVTVTDISVVLEQYGDKLEFTDVMQMTHTDPFLNQYIELVREQASVSLEKNRAAVLKGGSNVFYANGAASRAHVNSKAVVNDFRRIYRAMKRNKAQEISKILKATPNVATEPIGSAFIVLGHTDCLADLEQMSGWVPVEKYADSGKKLEGEAGKWGNFRFILSPIFEPWLQAGTENPNQSTYLTGGTSGTGAPDVYPLIVLAQNAFACSPLKGVRVGKGVRAGFQLYVRNPEPQIGDELAQRGFVSWKAWDACKILNQLWVARLEVAATAV